MWTYNYSSELYHHGILGQKWGIRRFQNKDGTLTSAGKKRNRSDHKPKDDGVKNSITGHIFKPVFKVGEKLVGAINIEKQMDSHVKRKDSIDSLNFYNDYKTFSEQNMKLAKGLSSQIKNNDYSDKISRAIAKIAGEKNIVSVYNTDYEMFKRMYEHSNKRSEELMKELKDVPLKEVDSLRYVAYGNTESYWQGKKYVKA